ncbi:GerAB/ArcD/ProY family transporter [Orenia marismortui]|uniref:Spore germination protein n=1 Tax=Orenia marismortui TaxID=46469 RepID=A0A4R8GU88_9FIRM|nr:GerAB/ArcD/ProY family transporter [Orenia marismortui]TDX48455.1 spore germination protein [Orenia marismortui]
MKGKISRQQVFYLSIIIVVPTLILSVPASLAKDAGTAGWISLILGGTLAGIFHYILLKLSLNFSNQSIIKDCKIILGPIWGRIILLPYVIVILSDTIFIFIETVDYMEFSMPQINTKFFYIAINLLTVYLVYNRVEVLCRISKIAVVIMIAAVAFMMILILFRGHIVDWNRIYPLNFKFKLIIKGSLLPLLWFVMIPNLLLMFKPYLIENQKSIKKSLYGNFFIQLLIISLFIITIAAFGIDLTSALKFPVYDLIKLTIKGFEVMVFVTWIMGTFLKLSVFYFVSSKIIAELFELSSSKDMIIPLAILFTASSIFSSQNILLENILAHIVVGQLFFGYGLSLFLFIILYFVFATRSSSVD